MTEMAITLTELAEIILAGQEWHRKEAAVKNPSYAVETLEEARELLRIMDKLLEARGSVLDAIPVCYIHGAQCVPHAIEWIEKVQIELTRLRRIEKALLNGQTHTDAAERFRAVAREFVLRQDRAPLFAIADALEGVGDNVDG